MRIVLVLSIERGGPVEHARLLARDLVALGARVRAVVPAAAVAARFAEVGAESRVLPLRRSLDAAGARELHRACRGADVVHSHDRRGGLWVRLGPRPSAAGVRVHSLHGLPEPYLPKPAGRERPGLRAVLAYRVLERGLAARTDALVVPSRAAALLLADRIGYPRAMLTVVPNGVDPVPAITGNGTLVGIVAALEPVKGVDVFLRAAAELAAVRPELRFAVFGTGSLGPSLEELAERLGLGPRIAFPGHVPAREALEQLRVFVLCSHMETSGMALLEAMAAGVPAVATRVGGIPETAPEGDVELVPPDDPAALAAAVARTLDDPRGAAARAARAREAVRRNATPARAAERTMGVYRAALERRNAA